MLETTSKSCFRHIVQYIALAIRSKRREKYYVLLFHYYVILPYKVKRTNKIRFMFWILSLENRSQNTIFLLQ